MLFIRLMMMMMRITIDDDTPCCCYRSFDYFDEGFCQEELLVFVAFTGQTGSDGIPHTPAWSSIPHPSVDPACKSA